MWGTTSFCDELTDDFGGAFEAISIDGCRLFCRLAEILPHSVLGLLQHNRLQKRTPLHHVRVMSLKCASERDHHLAPCRWAGLHKEDRRVFHAFLNESSCVPESLCHRKGACC